jgi:hypothetical protein
VKKTLLKISTLTLITTQSIASTSTKSKELDQVVFKDYGKISQSLFNNYAKVDDVEKKLSDYDILYYVPANLKGKKNIKALFFLHGGGQSTMTRSGSLRVAKSYINDLKSVADSLNVALICPSGSSQNWGGHMIDMLRDLKKIAVKDLNIDRNSIGLTGHSMGGMGITRSAHWLASEFSFFMPVAAGYDFNIKNEQVNPARKRNNSLYMNTYFNHRYLHLQGLQDHFQTFIERAKEQRNRIEAKEKLINRKSKYKLVFYNGSHNYPKTQYLNLLKTELENKRNPYQKFISGMEYNINELINNQWSNGFEIYYGKMNSYFWIEGLEHIEYKKVNSVYGKVLGNVISLTLDKNISKVRVYLDQKMVDLNKSVAIKVNGKTMYSDLVLKSKKSHKNLDYSTFVDVQL